MKNLIIVLLFLIIVQYGFTQNQPQNLLSGKYSPEELKQILIP